MSGHHEWVPLSLTLVEYPKGDIVGKLFAYTGLVPVAICVAFVTLILFRRDLHTLTFFIGQLLCESINGLLKNLIREARPLRRRFNYNVYGMPSSHSQFMWFFAIYVTLFVAFKLSNNNSNDTTFGKRVICGVVNLLALMVSLGRVYLEYHTWAQIVFGGLIGAVLATIWFTFTHSVFVQYFPVIASWKISEKLLIRDSTSIPNILLFEYINIRQESRTRYRKNASLKNQ